MRRAWIASLLLALSPLGIGAAHSAYGDLHLLSAELHHVDDADLAGAVDRNLHFLVTITVLNDGPTQEDRILINEWSHLNDLPFTQAYVDVAMDAGEVRTIQLDVRIRDLPDAIRFTNGPTWLCASVSADWTARCWSVWTGTPMPDGVYPEDVPNWQLLDAQYGDGDQE